MKCSMCGGGNVTWRGKLADLSHTECADCGGINCQEVEPEFEDCPCCWGLGTVEVDTGDGSSDNEPNIETCDNCDGMGYFENAKD